ncbi:MAG: hypothetical protein OXI83_20040 [Gemmatimonadota bacterium]|nr:hypothetical protein [Gemmatimonadota bacterium]
MTTLAARDLRQEFKTLRENDLKHVDTSIAALGAQIAGLGGRMGDLKTDMDARFGHVDARIDRVDARRAKAEERLEARIESVRVDMRDNHRQVLQAIGELKRAG